MRPEKVTAWPRFAAGPPRADSFNYEAASATRPACSHDLLPFCPVSLGLPEASFPLPIGDLAGRPVLAARLSFHSIILYPAWLSSGFSCSGLEGGDL